MRLVPFIACLLIASAAGCESSHGHRDAAAGAVDAAHASDGMTIRTASGARAEETASARSESIIDVAGPDSDAIASAAETARSAAEDAARAAGLDPAGFEHDDAWQADRPGIPLNVLVRDRRTGRPVADVGVEDGRTDASGRYQGRRPFSEPGETIQAWCPSRIGPVRTRSIGEAALVVRDGHADATIDVDTSVCVEPALRRERRRFNGIYSWGFEYSAFAPCEGMPEEAAYYADARFYWATLPDGIGAAVGDAMRQGDITGRDGRRVYVEWLGTSTGPGAYGHMGASRYRLDVEALYLVSATIPTHCHPRGLDNALIPLPPPPPPPTMDEEGNPLPVAS